MIDKTKGMLTYYDDFSRLRKIRPTVMVGVWAVFLGIFLVFLFNTHGV